MSNHLNLCRDGIFGTIFIKGKQIVDGDKNIKNIKSLTARNLKVRKDAEIGEDLSVLGNTDICGDLLVKGNVVNSGTNSVNNLLVEQDANICGDLLVKNKLTANNICTTDMTVFGNLTADFGLNMQGNCLLASDASTQVCANPGVIENTGDTIIDGELLVNQDANICGDLLLKGDTVTYGNIALGTRNFFGTLLPDLFKTLSGSQFYHFGTVNDRGNPGFTVPDGSSWVDLTGGAGFTFIASGPSGADTTSWFQFDDVPRSGFYHIQLSGWYDSNSTGLRGIALHSDCTQDPIPITNVTAAGGFVTYTLPTAFITYIKVGTVISITNVISSPVGVFNLSDQIVTGVSPTSVTVMNPATGTYISGGETKSSGFIAMNQVAALTGAPTKVEINKTVPLIKGATLRTQVMQTSGGPLGFSNNGVFRDCAIMIRYISSYYF